MLLGMNGESIESVNGNEWLVTAANDTIFLSNMEGPQGLTNVTVLVGPSSSDILASNGVIHYVDGFLLDKDFQMVDGCTVCMGSPDPTANFGTAMSCTDWVTQQQGANDANSEDCLEERAAGAVLCGCDAPEELLCNLCNGTIVDISISPPPTLNIDRDRILPVSAGITCDDMALVPAGKLFEVTG